MRSRGVSAVEVLIAVMIGAAVTVPVLALLFQERDTEQRSRFEYLALLIARDEMYQARMLVGMGADPQQVAHTPRKLSGNPLASIGGTFFDGTPPGPVYPDEMLRIASELVIDGPSQGTPHLHPAHVKVTWLDPDLAKSSANVGRKTDLELHFGVLTPPGGTP